MSVNVARRAVEYSGTYQNLIGGKSPQIVFEDADFDAAVPVVVNAIVQNGGQTCSAGSRVLVQKSIYDEFVAQIADGVPSGGFYVAPVLFGPVPRDNALACDEVFGPVLSIITFEDEADAVKLAREKGMEALHEFSHTKTIVFKHG